MFSNSYTLVIPWGDCDPAGIVFFPRFFEMFDEATAALLQAATGLTRAQLIETYGLVGWPMVDTRAEFHATARFDDHVRIDGEITRLGRTSFAVTHTLWRGETLCVTAHEIRVLTVAGSDPARPMVPCAIPETMRAQLEGQK